MDVPVELEGGGQVKCCFCVLTLSAGSLPSRRYLSVTSFHTLLPLQTLAHIRIACPENEAEAERAAQSIADKSAAAVQQKKASVGKQE